MKVVCEMRAPRGGIKFQMDCSPVAHAFDMAKEELLKRFDMSGDNMNDWYEVKLTIVRSPLGDKK